jgi:hypothetical protein
MSGLHVGLELQPVKIMAHGVVFQSIFYQKYAIWGRVLNINFKRFPDEMFILLFNIRGHHKMSWRHICIAYIIHATIWLSLSVGNALLGVYAN